jgi:uncharacterized protein (TIRG00374 family)
MSTKLNHDIKPPSTKTIKRGIQGFILFSFLGLVFIIWWKTPAGLKHLSQVIQSPAILLILALVILDYIIGGFRYSLFFDGRVLPKISLWNSMRSNWANIFMGAVTPFQTGGGPAQLYILWRCGAKISQGALVSLINLSSTLFFFQIASLTAIFILPDYLFGEQITPIIRSGFFALIIFAGVVGLVLTFPTIGYRIIEFIFKLMPNRFIKLHGIAIKLLEILKSEIVLFRENFRQILKEKKTSLVIIVFTTMILFFNKYLLGYIIAVTLSPGIHFDLFLGLQIIQYFLIYFAPTPGASGLAEVSSTWLMNKIMAADVLVFYAILFRLFTTISGAIIGGIVLVLDLKSLTKTQVETAEITTDNLIYNSVVKEGDSVSGKNL